MITEVIFDCETQKLFNEIATSDPGDLGVSLVSLYLRTVDETQREITGTMMSFWEKDLPQVWEIFDRADRIIGFNFLNDGNSCCRLNNAYIIKLPQSCQHLASQLLPENRPPRTFGNVLIPGQSNHQYITQFPGKVKMAYVAGMKQIKHSVAQNYFPAFFPQIPAKEGNL